MFKPTSLKWLGVLVLLICQTGCVPMITREWDVQPVLGQVVDGETGEPVNGARIVNSANPQLSAESDGNGEFFIEAESKIRFHLLMFGSFIDRQVWQVSHDAYANGVTLTSTHRPAFTEQLSEPVVPLFKNVDQAPDSCPFGPYLLRLYDWALHHRDPRLVAYDFPPAPSYFPCEDEGYRGELSEAYYHRLWEAVY